MSSSIPFSLRFSLPTLFIFTAVMAGGALCGLSASEPEPKVALAVNQHDAEFVQATFSRLAYVISATEIAEIHAVNHPWAGQMGALKTDTSKMRNDLLALMKAKMVGVQMLQPEVAAQLDALSKAAPDRVFALYRDDQLQNLEKITELLSEAAESELTDPDVKAFASAWAPIIARQHEALQNAEGTLPSE